MSYRPPGRKEVDRKQPSLHAHMASLADWCVYNTESHSIPLSVEQVAELQSPAVQLLRKPNGKADFAKEETGQSEGSALNISVTLKDSTYPGVAEILRQ